MYRDPSDVITGGVDSSTTEIEDDISEVNQTIFNYVHHLLFLDVTMRLSSQNNVNKSYLLTKVLALFKVGDLKSLIVRSTKSK